MLLLGFWDADAATPLHAGCPFDYTPPGRAPSSSEIIPSSVSALIPLGPPSRSAISYSSKPPSAPCSAGTAAAGPPDFTSSPPSFTFFSCTDTTWRERFDGSANDFPQCLQLYGFSCRPPLHERAWTIIASERFLVTVPAQMRVVVFPHHERFLAHVTLVRAHIFVPLDVRPVLRARPEPGLTHAALERFVARVDPLVLLQVAALGKALRAVLALERLDTVVPIEMLVVAGLVGELLVADRAPVPLGAVMRPGVLGKGGARFERRLAHRAPVQPVLHVRLPVPVQQILLPERFPTLDAHERVVFVRVDRSFVLQDAVQPGERIITTIARVHIITALRWYFALVFAGRRFLRCTFAPSLTAGCFVRQLQTLHHTLADVQRLLLVDEQLPVRAKLEQADGTFEQDASSTSTRLPMSVLLWLWCTKPITWPRPVLLSPVTSDLTIQSFASVRSRSSPVSPVAGGCGAGTTVTLSTCSGVGGSSGSVGTGGFGAVSSGLNKSSSSNSSSGTSRPSLSVMPGFSNSSFHFSGSIISHS
uniref:Uncharacterized protein n=1 Tax=Anopheles melas TaxID=34690 RepID=A0A182TXF1_9DIPT